MMIRLIVVALISVAVSLPVDNDSPYYPTYELTGESIARASPPRRYSNAPTQYTSQPEVEEEVYDLSNIPGEPGQDYPIYYSIPNTQFTCGDKRPGFYADVAAGCQVWHYCDTDYRSESFLCPNGTIYDQERRVCEWWYNVNCANAEKFYSVNEDLYIIPEPYYKGGDEKFSPESKTSYQVKPKPQYKLQDPPKPQEAKYLPVDTRYPEASYQDTSYVEPAPYQNQRARNYQS